MRIERIGPIPLAGRAALARTKHMGSSRTGRQLPRKQFLSSFRLVARRRVPAWERSARSAQSARSVSPV